jgi:hypothetical protein
VTAPASAFEPWIELANDVGPTPRAGPLTHDFVLPADREPPSLGLTVFSHHGGDALIQVARTWAAEWLGSSSAIEPLFERQAVWHGGIGVIAGKPKLKLYATSGLEDLGHLLGVDVRDAIAVGVDATRRGLDRARAYFDPKELAPPEGWPDRTPATSHRIVTKLLGAQPKTTFSTIFRSDADLSELGDSTLELASETSRLAQRHGFVLRPAAHEIDVFGDGRVETDVLLTAGTA